MLDSFNGFYFIEGDSTANVGKIGKTFGYNSDISNNLSDGITVTFNDLLSKFTNPISLGYTNGLYVCKYIVEDNEDETRKNINTSEIVWKKVFSIANYIYNKFYFFAERNFAQFQNYDYDEYINGVLTGNIVDQTIVSTNTFDIYQNDSLEFTHLSENQGETYYYKLKKFKFKINWNNDEIEFTMWVNPQSFKNEFHSNNPFVYIYYNENIGSQTTSISEISENIANRNLPFYKTLDIPAKLVSGEEYTIVSVPFHIWSNDTIPIDVLGSSEFLQKIQYVIKEKESTLNSSQLARRWPTVFSEEERTIYPITDNQAINSVDYQNSLNESLVINPVNIASLNELISTIPDLSPYEKFESTSIKVGSSIIPFIIAGLDGALTDKIPFFRPTIDEIENLSGYDVTKINAAKDFVKYLSAVLTHQINGNTGSLDIPDSTEIEFEETDEYCTFKYLGIVWKVINRNYDPANLGD